MICKYRVIVMKADNRSYTEIEGVSGFKRGTISKLIKKFGWYGDVNKNLHSNAGRPETLNE